MNTQLDFKNYFQKGVGYEQYKIQMAEDLHSNSDAQLKEYIKLNTQRMQRVEKTYTVSDSLKHLLNQLTEKVNWLLIAEHWCGDVAQTISAMNKIAEESNGKITFKIVYRDQNTELMDAFLTNNARSIPKLLQLDNDYELTGQWGPRSVEAQELVVRLKSNPETAETYASALHLWYAEDKQKKLERDLIELVKSNL